MTRQLLRVECLRTSFAAASGDASAVEDVSFELFEGETLCIVGESGSGKSVTARSIMQIVDQPGRIVAGRILLHRYDKLGQESIIDIATLAPRGSEMRAVRRHDMSMIFQEPMSALSPVHRCGDQIVEKIRLARPVPMKAAREQAVELIGQMRLTDPEKVARQYPFELSGGMRQRIMIAMALASNPRILIADEPTTALDVTTQAEILDLIAEVQEERGLGVVFITHDIGVVARIASRVAVMCRGRVVEQGPVDRVLRAPEHPYTQLLLDASARLESRSPLKPAARPADRAPQARSEGGKAPVLSIRGLEKRFGPGHSIFRRTRAEVAAVADVSFDLWEGESVGVVGESGSGKTTMARCIAGLHRVSGGTMAYRRPDGSTIDLAGGRRRPGDPLYREIRMIFQDPFSALNPRMTVGQIIAEPLLVNGVGRGAALKERVADLLRQVGLPSWMMERYPHAFSGGQRQRIVVARAIALNPRIVIADEATSALDVSLRARTLDLLLELQERLSLTFLFITHDISTVRYFCDRVAVMHQGRVVEMGTVDHVLETPNHPYTRKLISAVPRIHPVRLAAG